jgi:outer membrane protein, heavy metal efflux system
MRDDLRARPDSVRAGSSFWRQPAWLIAAVILLGSGGELAAQAGGLSLAEARALAQRGSPEVAAARAAVEAAAGRERQAGAIPNPTLLYSREQASRGGETNSQDVAAIEQRVEVGGQRGARVAAARLAREAAEAMLAAAEADVGLAVGRAYAEAVAADRRAQLAATTAGQFEAAVRITQVRLAAGDESGYATRRIRLEGARYAALAAEARLEQRQARLRLSTLTGTRADTSLAGFPVAPGSVALAPDSLGALVLRWAPELRAARLQAEARGAEALLARRERIPTPVASLGYKDERQAGTDETFRGFVAGVSIPLPLWDRRGGAIEAADAETRRATAELEAVRRRIERDARAALEAAQQADAQAEALAAQLGPEAEAALRAAQVAYSEGEITLVEWLDTVRAYQEAESAFGRVFAETIIQRATLERLLGVALIP